MARRRETRSPRGATESKPDPRIRELHAAPPAEFVAARDALSRELATEGSAEAARVKRLRRPTAALWLLNALARERPDAVAGLFAAGDRLRQAQVRALRGDAGQLRAGNAALHEALTSLGSAAEELAASRLGRPAGAGTLGEVERALRAVATADEGARAELREAVLTQLPEAGGIELLTGLAAVPSPEGDAAPARRGAEEPARGLTKPTPPRRGDAERARAAAEKHARAEAARRDRDRERAVFEAERLERAQRAAEEQARAAERSLEDAQRRADAAREEAEAARDRARVAREKADAAARDREG